MLKQRLLALNAEIARLRKQQQRLATLLAQSALRRNRPQNKAGWVELLRQAGFDEQDMQRWHAEFERASPAAHVEFLGTLGLSRTEIEHIRRRSTRTDISSEIPVGGTGEMSEDRCFPAKYPDGGPPRTEE